MIRETAIMVFAAVFYIGHIRAPSKRCTEESNFHCSSTTTVKPPAQMTMEKVDEPSKLIEKEGLDVFPNFKGKHGSYIFAGRYKWTNDLEGKMLMHPIIPTMENQDGLKDRIENVSFVK
jgi:hypothetical protein